jgi:hypothetical protein
VKIMDHFTATYSELSESSVYKDTLNYEFWLSLYKIVRSSVILLLPLLKKLEESKTLPKV